MSKRLVVRVQWIKKEAGWRIADPKGQDRIYTGLRKTAVVTAARRRAKALYADGYLTQLVVHNKDGEIGFENTYGKDPKSSRG